MLADEGPPKSKKGKAARPRAAAPLPAPVVAPTPAPAPAPAPVSTMATAPVPADPEPESRRADSPAEQGPEATDQEQDKATRPSSNETPSTTKPIKKRRGKRDRSRLPQFDDEGQGESDSESRSDMDIDVDSDDDHAPNADKPTPDELYQRYPANRKRVYRTKGTGRTAVFHCLKNDFLGHETKKKLASLDDDMRGLVDNVPRLSKVDFASLREPDYEWEQRKSIDPDQVEMMDAALVHYDMDYGLVYRYLSGEWSGEWRNTEECVAAAEASGVDQEDCDAIRRILNEGCPAEFSWEESAENKESFIRQGNSPAVMQHKKQVTKALAKEVRNHHLMPFSRWTVRASPFGHVVPQTVNDKNPEKARIIWDGKTKRWVWQTTMNEQTPTANEPLVTFGHVYQRFITWIWKLRLTFPHEEIYLATVDISSCFRFPRIWFDLAGAFGFAIGSLYFASNSMVFGSIVSAASWEPFRRAIAAIAMTSFFLPHLVEKHKKLLAMISWDDPPPKGTTFVQATPCTQHQGIEKEDGTMRPTPHHIYVDDNLLADTRSRMLHTLAAALEAIFTVMGFPMLLLRQCAVAMDKWRGLHVSHCMVLLGLVFNTRKMTVGATKEYRQMVIDLLRGTWHSERESFTVNEMEKLIGKLGRLGQAYRPIYHLMPQLYASLAYALRKSKFYLTSTNRRFREMLKQITLEATNEEDAREINFAQRVSSKMLHKSKRLFRIPDTLRRELDLILRVLMDPTIILETPFAHIVERDPTWGAWADACKRAGGGWSTDLKFWWYFPFWEDIYKRACLPDNKTKRLVSINVLEMVCIIINYAAVIHICWLDGIDLSTYPVLMNGCDNASATSWVNSKCKTSLLGRELGILFSGLLTGTKIGINAEWLDSKSNFLADAISRLNQKKNGYKYDELLTEFPQLRTCRRFKPSRTLLGMIFRTLDEGVSPDPLILKNIKPSALGSVTSSIS